MTTEQNKNDTAVTNEQVLDQSVSSDRNNADTSEILIAIPKNTALMKVAILAIENEEQKEYSGTFNLEQINISRLRAEQLLNLEKKQQDKEESDEELFKEQEDPDKHLYIGEDGESEDAERGTEES